MRYPGFCGPSGAVASSLASAERTVNLIPWPVKAMSTDMMLVGTPGQTSWAVTTDTGTRALFTTGDQVFAVIGTGLWECYENSSPVSRGTVAQDAYPATISYNGLTGGELFITSGGNGYCYDLSTATLTQVLTGDATMGGAKDGRFLAFDETTGIVRMSDLNDGLTWSGSLYFQRSLAPDPWRAMVVTQSEIWLIGEETGEVWYDAGTYPQPFAPSPGAFFTFGTRDPFSVQIAGDAVIWLSHTTDGAGQVVMARGYTPTPISSDAVEHAIARYNEDGHTRDVETLVYQEAGHLYACVSFPSANATWCVDLSTNLWHERGTWNPDHHRYDAWTPRCHCHAFGLHLVGDRATGTLSQMSQSLSTEADGGLIRRLRIGPTLLAEPGKRLQMDTFTLLVSTGTALQTGQGSDPLIWLRESTDSETWSSARQRSLGAIGEYGRIVSWTRCATSLTAWIPEIVLSDPIPVRILGADIRGSGFSSGAAT